MVYNSVEAHGSAGEARASFSQGMGDDDHGRVYHSAKAYGSVGEARASSYQGMGDVDHGKVHSVVMAKGMGVDVHFSGLGLPPGVGSYDVRQAFLVGVVRELNGGDLKAFSGRSSLRLRPCMLMAVALCRASFWSL